MRIGYQGLTILLDALDATQLIGEQKVRQKLSQSIHPIHRCQTCNQVFGLVQNDDFYNLGIISRDNTRMEVDMEFVFHSFHCGLKHGRKQNTTIFNR